MLVASGCVPGTHNELICHILFTVDQNAYLASVAPLVNVLLSLASDESFDFIIAHTVFLTLFQPFWQLVMISMNIFYIS